MSDNVNFQAIPPADSGFLTMTGGVNPVWYRFLHSLWSHVSSGTPSTTTLQGSVNDAAAAQTTANNAAAAAAAERVRALTAEAGLEAQITSVSAQIAALQGEVTTLQGQTASLQSQINTINSRLTAAGIP